MINTKRYSPKQVSVLRDNFVGNEVGSDEYRETWPEKGLSFLAEALELEPDEGRRRKLMKAAQSWIISYNKQAEKVWGYPGVDAAEPLCNLIFDSFWGAGKHPYFYTDEEVREDLEI